MFLRNVGWNSTYYIPEDDTLLLDDFSITGCTALNGRMTDDVARIVKEAVVT
jgi:hypothetical protein